MLRKFWTSEDGASLAEYALLLAFIALASFGAVEALGIDLVPFFDTVASKGFGGD